MGRYGAQCGCVGRYGAQCGSIGQLWGAVWLCGALWGAMGCSVAVWGAMGRSVAVWGCVGLCVAVWGAVGRSGALWGAHRLHPKMGGAVHAQDHSQEKRIPATANFPSNLMFPNGLHTTNHRSHEMIASDHSAVMPATYSAAP